jgi:hypothetical protein
MTKAGGKRKHKGLCRSAGRMSEASRKSSPSSHSAKKSSNKAGAKQVAKDWDHVT